jgi:hypothetical protein
MNLPSGNACRKMRIRHTDRASGQLTAEKHVRNVVNFWMTAGPRNLHTTDQKVRGSNPFGRALRSEIFESDYQDGV